MKQVLIGGTGEVVVADVPAPMCPVGGVLVRVTHSLISTGTESMSIASGGKKQSLVIKAIKNPHLVAKVLQKASTLGVRETLALVKNRTRTYMATGYSAAGVVVEVGAGVTGFSVGDRVACAGAGLANHAEVVAVPQNLCVRVPAGVENLEAAFVTLGAIALQGVRRAETHVGETVLVVGLGLIGLLAVQILKASGCRVIGADVVASRVEFAREFGMDVGVVIGQGPELPVVCRAETGGYGVDAALLCAATPSSIPANSAMESCRERGRVVVVGDVGMNLRREAMYRKELDFVISRSYGPGRYDRTYEEKGYEYPYGFVRWTENRNMAEFLRLISTRQVKVRELITQVYPVAEAAAAYHRIATDRKNVTALLFSYPAAEKVTAVSREDRRINLSLSGSARTGTVRVGLIGAGGFAQSVHLPNLKKLGAELRAVASRTAHNARQHAENYGAAYATTDYRELLADPEIDAILLTTRHNLRREIILEAAAAGKHVFVEKPLAITVEDCEAIQQAVEQHGILLTVGFNRRFSPTAQLLKRELSSTPGPKMMQYRVNAGALPPDHWTYDPVEGGGRIIGEGVHFFDFLAFLCDEEPVSVKAEHAEGFGNSVQDQDNLVATIRFSGGSVGTLLYTGAGNTGSGKERVEVFCAGRSAVLDDFKDLSLWGFSTQGVKNKYINKGQLELLANFLDAVRGTGKLGVTVVDGVRATRMANMAYSSARQEVPGS